MEVIDEQGRVFGIVNVVDLLVVLLVLAVVAAGVALVLGGGGGAESSEETVTLTVRVENVEPYVVEALPDAGAVDAGNVTAVENKSVENATIVTTNDAGEVLVREHPRLQTVELQVRMTATRTDRGLVAGRQPLRVGRPLGLDFGTVELQGDVTSIQTDGPAQ